MHECNSRFIIECYGSYLADPNICICMQFMDRGSFESIYKKIGPIQIEVVARVAMSVLEGLTYLYDVHRIIHRGPSLSLSIPLPDLDSPLRHQTLQHPLQHPRRNKTMRLWCLWRTDQLDSQHLCRHLHLYERKLSPSPSQRLPKKTMISLNESRAQNTPSNLISGPSASRSSSSPQVVFLFQIQTSPTLQRHRPLWQLNCLIWTKTMSS